MLRISSFSVLQFFPKTVAIPSSVSTNPQMMFIDVVFPAPLGPSKPVMVFSFTDRESPLSAGDQEPLYCFFMFVNSTAKDIISQSLNPERAFLAVWVKDAVVIRMR